MKKEKNRQWSVVICGSMSHYQSMANIQKALYKESIISEIPKPDSAVYMNLESCIPEVKRQASMAHIKKIRSPWTHAILVVNLDKHGIDSYIGPNTFAEIAVAFAQMKNIYLLNGIPDFYWDELSAWGAIPLRGNLKILVRDYLHHLREPQQILLPGMQWL